MDNYLLSRQIPLCMCTISTPSPAVWQVECSEPGSSLYRIFWKITIVPPSLIEMRAHSSDSLKETNYAYFPKCLRWKCRQVLKFYRLEEMIRLSPVMFPQATQFSVYCDSACYMSTGCISILSVDMLLAPECHLAAQPAGSRPA